MRATTYTPAQVTKALTRLAYNDGNVELTASELIDDEFMVPEDTLRAWQLDEHQAQYKQLAGGIADQLEADVVAKLRKNAKRIGELQEDMIEAVGRIDDPRLMPNALRALSDAKAKSTNELLQLTGRPTNGTAAGSLVELTQALMASGLLVAAPGVSVEPPVKVLNEAESKP